MASLPPAVMGPARVMGLPSSTLVQLTAVISASRAQSCSPPLPYPHLTCRTLETCTCKRQLHFEAVRTASPLRLPLAIRCARCLPLPSHPFSGPSASHRCFLPTLRRQLQHESQHPHLTRYQLVIPIPPLPPCPPTFSLLLLTAASSPPPPAAARRLTRPPPPHRSAEGRTCRHPACGQRGRGHEGGDG